MISTSPGSPPDAKRFLDWYTQAKEDEITELQQERVPEKGDYALRGKEDTQTISGMVKNRVIQI